MTIQLPAFAQYITAFLCGFITRLLEPMMAGTLPTTREYIAAFAFGVIGTGLFKAKPPAVPPKQNQL